MKQICLLICVLLCCTNALAQEQKKLRKTVQTTERPLPKPRQAEPNPTLSPATPPITTPNVQEKPLSIADSIAIANRFWNANDNLNLRLTQPLPTQATSLSSTPATNYNRAGQLGEWKGLNFYGQSYRETFPAMLVRQGATVGVSRTWDKLSFSAFAQPTAIAHSTQPHNSVLAVRSPIGSVLMSVQQPSVAITACSLSYLWPLSLTSTVRPTAVISPSKTIAMVLTLACNDVTIPIDNNGLFRPFSHPNTIFLRSSP